MVAHQSLKAQGPWVLFCAWMVVDLVDLIDKKTWNIDGEKESKVLARSIKQQIHSHEKFKNCNPLSLRSPFPLGAPLWIHNN